MIVQFKTGVVTFPQRYFAGVLAYAWITKPSAIPPPTTDVSGKFITYYTEKKIDENGAKFITIWEGKYMTE